MKTILTVILLLNPMMLFADYDTQKGSQTTYWKTDGIDKAQSIEDVKKSLPFANEWKSFEWKGNSILVGLSDFPSFGGESYIDIHGYIYNRSDKEWKRFCVAKTRNVGAAEVGLDAEKEELYLLALANTPMKGKRVFTYSLLLLSDDRSYLREKDGVDQPVADPKLKSEREEKIKPEAEVSPQ